MSASKKRPSKKKSPKSAAEEPKTSSSKQSQAKKVTKKTPRKASARKASTRKPTTSKRAAGKATARTKDSSTTPTRKRSAVKGSAKKKSDVEPVPGLQSMPTPQRVTVAYSGGSYSGASQLEGLTASPPPVVVERLLTPDEVLAEYLVRQAELEDQFAKARAALQKWLPTLKKSQDFQSGQITGVSVRYRTKFGQVVSPLQVVIGVNVARKLRLEALEARGFTLLPTEIEGVSVKVVEGRFDLLSPNAATFLRSSAASPHDPLNFDDPLVGGAPIAPPGRPEEFGTLGVVVAADDGTFLGLTCQHVVSSDVQVDQRGPDSGLAFSTRPIGTVTRRLKDDHDHHGVIETLDCASIEFRQPPDGVVAIVFPPTGSWIRGLTHPGDGPPGADFVPLYYSKIRAENGHSIFPIWKFGSASGQVVKGRIKDVDNSLFVINGQAFENNFTVQHFDGNQVFATPGDSGSVLALEAEVDGRHAFVAIGILFASIQGNASIGLACNMSHILDALEPKIPTQLLIDAWDRR